MKTLVLLCLTMSHFCSFGQNYFDGTITFKIIENGKPLSYDDFIGNWKIIDDRDCIQMFYDDTVSRNGDYFELKKDKRNFVKYSDSSKLFSIKLGRSDPYFTFRLVNGLDTVSYFSMEAGNYKCDSIYADRERYYFGPGQYFEGLKKYQERSVLLDMHGVDFDINLLKSQGILRER